MHKKKLRRNAWSDELSLTVLFCVVQVLALAGSMTYQTLIPQFVTLWHLSNTEAAWIASITYVTYAFSAPLLVAWTDRVDARLVVLGAVAVSTIASLGFAWTADGFWSAIFWRALVGFGVAGSYMPGLKALTDRLSPEKSGRYQSFYTASYALGSGTSMLVAGLLADQFDHEAAFMGAAVCTSIALMITWLFIPPKAPPGKGSTGKLFDMRLILSHKPTFGYILAYSGHAFELFGFRTWVVAFLTMVVAASPADLSISSVATLATIIIMLGLPASILGNELAMRFDRRKVLFRVMLLSGGIAILLGFSVHLSLWIVLPLAALYGMTTMMDSAAITVGTLSEATPERRGATIAVQTFLASMMALISPLACGWSLDQFGDDTMIGWGITFSIMGAGAIFGALGLKMVAREPKHK